MNRPTVFAALVTLAAAAGPLRAQPEVPPPIKLVVKPAAAPSPAMKYRLLPELRDTKPGNAALYYYRAFSPEWQGFHRDSKSYLKIYEAAQAPLKDVPRDEVGWVAQSNMLKEVDRAARLQYCDWNLTERLREEGIGMLFPDVQSMREFATLLKLRAKLDLRDGRHDRAAYTLQTGLKMGRDVADGPTLIQSLVGIAICWLLLEEVEEWVQVPDAPNLYWALSDLPHPMVSLRKPLQGERLNIDTYFPGYLELLANPKAAPNSPQQVEEHIDKILPLIDQLKNNRALLVTLVMRDYPEAKKFLMARGRSAEQVAALPVVQAVLLHEIARYDEMYEEMYKYTSLPYWEARPGLLAVDKQLKAMAADAGGPGGTLATLLLPSVIHVYSAHARLDRKVAALRCVEAIRLYAAAHEGQLPAQLDDIKEVPVPSDPYTGKPFRYEVKDGKAHLTGVAPGDEPANAGNYLRYEVTLTK
jgi:hypothetical protein